MLLLGSVPNGRRAAGSGIPIARIGGDYRRVFHRLSYWAGRDAPRSYITRTRNAQLAIALPTIGSGSKGEKVSRSNTEASPSGMGLF